MTKLTREQKIIIYHKRKLGVSIPSLSKEYEITESKINYLIRLIDKHGTDILRNGKNEVVAMCELYGLMKGEHILHTAHRTTTTHSAWERLLKLIEKTDLEVESTFKAFGKEHIFLTNGGRCEFRTRTSKGGLGEGFDLLIIDEAQEYQDDQETALKYVVSDSLNPQTLFCGTPPTVVSSGTIFTKMRDRVLCGKSNNTRWVEWLGLKLMNYLK